MNVRLSLAILITGGGQFLLADTAIIARFRKSEVRIERDGAERVTKSTSSVIYRSSQGRVLRIEGADLPDGSFAPKTGQLEDPMVGKKYSIDYVAKRATVAVLPARARPMESVAETIGRARAKGIQERAILGIHCFGFPIVGEMADKVESFSGTGWRSLEHDLTIRLERYFVFRDGTQFRVVTEPISIEVGREPAEETFQVPAGFTISN